MTTVALTARRFAPALSPRLARSVLGFLVVLAALEAFTRAGFVSAAYLPPASTVLAATARLLIEPAFLAHIAATMQAWGIGMGLAIVVAVPLGVVLGSSSATYAAARSLIEFLRPIPSVALIPLAILLFGRDTTMKVSLIVYASVWPILFNTIYGMHDVDPVAKDTARSFGLGRLEVLRRVALPSAAPFISTGIRVAAAIALILALSAELLAGGTRGLGTWMLYVAQTGGAQEFVYAGTVVTGLLGLLLNTAMVAGERRLFAWHHGVREAG